MPSFNCRPSLTVRCVLFCVVFTVLSHQFRYQEKDGFKKGYSPTGHLLGPFFSVLGKISYGKYFFH